MGTYRTKVEQPCHSPFLGRRLEPGEEMELDDTLARQVCDRTESVEYPPAQAVEMKRVGYDVKIEDRKAEPQRVDALRARGFRVSAEGGYRVAVGSRKIRGLLEPVKGKAQPKAKGK